MFKSLTTDTSSVIYKVIYKKVTKAWDVTYPLTVKRCAVKYVRTNTKKHNSFLSLLMFWLLNTVTSVPLKTPYFSSLKLAAQGRQLP